MEVIYLAHQPTDDNVDLGLDDGPLYDSEISATTDVPLEETGSFVSSLLAADADISNTVLVPILSVHTPNKPITVTNLTAENLSILTEESPQSKTFRCDFCQKEFTRQTYLNLHLRTHTGEKPFCCEQCGKSFSDPSSLARHKRSHTGVKPYKCEVCEKCFSQSAHLQAHRDNVHKKEKLFCCEHCQVRFSNVYHLQRHMRIHTGEKPYKCDQCDKTFRSASSWVIHKRGHSGEKPYPCNTCGKTFIDSSSLKNHARIHTGEKPFTCKICGSNFGKRWSLKKHMNSRHKNATVADGIAVEAVEPQLLEICTTKTSGTKQHVSRPALPRPAPVKNPVELPYRCANCSKMFGNVSNLRHHIRIHSGEKPYKCQICGKMFSQSTHLKTHQKVHDRERADHNPGQETQSSDSVQLQSLTPTGKIQPGEKPFTCSFCGEAFASDSSWRIHERKHTGEKPFQCTYCEQKFSYSNVLKRHVRSHTGEKPYSCTECGRSFIDSWARKKHMRKHSKEKLFPCTLCQKTYATDWSLRQHQQKVHSLTKVPLEQNTCSVCSETFTMEWSLKIHTETCHGEERVNDDRNRSTLKNGDCVNGNYMTSEMLCNRITDEPEKLGDNLTTNILTCSSGSLWTVANNESAISLEPQNVTDPVKQSSVSSSVDGSGFTDSSSLSTRQRTRRQTAITRNNKL